MIIVANKIKIIKNKDSKSLSSYYIDMINKETNYWFNVSIIKNLSDLNNLEVNKKIDSISFFDCYDISFGDDKTFSVIMNQNNVNIYITKIKDSIFDIEFIINNFNDTIGNAPKELEGLIFRGRLDFNLAIFCWKSSSLRIELP